MVVSEREELPETRRLRDVEREEFVVVQMARGHAAQVAPTENERNCGETQPAVRFRKTSNGM